MDVRIKPGLLTGEVAAIPSKSVFHRAAFLAAMGDAPCKIYCGEPSEDMQATLRVVRALGSDVAFEGSWVTIGPARPDAAQAELSCGESGTTLRFALAVAAALGRRVKLTCEGRLPERPLGALRDALVEGGATLSAEGTWPLALSGSYAGGEHQLPGNVSSQFVSALLLAAANGAGTTLHVAKPVESLPYITLTCETLATFGVNVGIDEDDDELRYVVAPGSCLRSPASFAVEGDWSSASIWLGAAALGSNLHVAGLSTDTVQADAAMLDMICALGGSASYGDGLASTSGPLTGGVVDISSCPDLAPTLAAIASFAQGETRITGAGRLRLKESDRLAACANVICSLGGTAEVAGDELLVEGSRSISGGSCSSHGDHRIAMMAALMATRATGDVIVRGAECVAKSYPGFWHDYSQLGGHIEEMGS